ncbi:hypothetical protein JCM8547_006299 [Rhodosporidiobolus lusitaniae]
MPPSNPDAALPATYPSTGELEQDGTAHDESQEQHMDEGEFVEADDNDEEEVYESDSSPSTETDTLTWINWFCSLPGHEYFCEVAEDFIEDDFNLTGLAGLVPFYKEAMEMILDVEPEDDEAHRVPDVSIVESSAELLYGLIHQRYIITRMGLQAMQQKYEQAHFGTCPRVFCGSAKLVPCGRSDLPGVDTVKLFCSNCLDMYVPPSSRFQGVDGAFFGTTFPHLLAQTYPPPTNTLPVQPAPSNPSEREPTTPLTSAARVYVPRIYGFKVSERARSGPRMMWMRMRPRTEGELDWDDTPVPAAGASGPGGGGTGEKGDLFDDDRLEDEEEDEEEEEEEGGAAAGAAPPAAGGAQEDADLAKRVQETRLASPPTTTTTTTFSSAAPPPAARQHLPPAKDGRAIKPLPRSPTTRLASPSTSSPSAPVPPSSSPSSLPQPPSAASIPPAPSAAAAAASAALAKSIQAHLAASSSMGGGVPELPKPPKAKVWEEREQGRARVGRVA